MKPVSRLNIIMLDSARCGPLRPPRWPATFAYRDELHGLVVVRDIRERAQAYELLERRVKERTRELSTLLEVSNDVASTLELEPLLGLILDQLGTVVDYTDSSMLVFEGEDLVTGDLRLCRVLECSQQQTTIE